MVFQRRADGESDIVMRRVENNHGKKIDERTRKKNITPGRGQENAGGTRKGGAMQGKNRTHTGR